jgi:chitinase
LYQATVITNGISLFGFGATGHMIPVMQQVGDLIDLIAFQGYNCGASTNREIMYDSYAYYAEKHGFVIAAGVHYPNEPWGPYYQYTHKNVAALAGHIKNLPSRTDNNDGIMIWELLLENTVLKSSAFSYMHVASLVLGGSTETNAVQNALNYTSEPYKGGAQGCGTNNGGGSTSFCGVQAYKAANQYATPNTKVYYQCKIWYNKWYANSNEIPGSNKVWEVESNCSEELSCSPLSVSQSFIANVFSIFPNPATNYLQVSFVNENREWEIYNQQGLKVLSGKDPTINISMLSQGLYLIQSGESKKIFMKK